MSNLFQEVGRRIQEILNERNMQQTELANKLGISKQVLYKILHGKKAINIVEIRKIANALDVRIEKLIPAEEEMSKNENPVLLMMGKVSHPNTKEDLQFLDFVMDEIIALKKLNQ